MNITEILKNAPKGTKLYSPICGECELVSVIPHAYYPIEVQTKLGIHSFTDSGLLYKDDHYGECMLFPSRDNKDWSKFTLNKFDINTLQPFDKVLVRDGINDIWKADFYSYYMEKSSYPFRCVANYYIQCIPYNDETKHLVGKTSDCPEYYKTW